jgi:L-alanine-DL-glutamate epimerase-like enolase superfamily enzyme
MADESATDLATTVRLLVAGRIEALNIKLMKVGGISPAMALDRVAAAFGVATMVSCMDEAALAIAAGLQFALASPNVRWVDLDGHLDLVDDPTAPSVALERGVLCPAAGPGFGCPDIG